MEVKRVLLVEDDDCVQRMITQTVKAVFGEDTEVFVADSLQAVEVLFDQDIGDLEAIFLDTYLKGDETTFELAKKIALQFSRPLLPIIATSASPAARSKMLANGCSHECSKSGILKFLLDWKEEHCK
jgi:CheY-like chemotaxis protein